MSWKLLGVLELIGGAAWRRLWWARHCIEVTIWSDKSFVGVLEHPKRIVVLLSLHSSLAANSALGWEHMSNLPVVVVCTVLFVFTYVCVCSLLGCTDCAEIRRSHHRSCRGTWWRVEPVWYWKRCGRGWNGDWYPTTQFLCYGCFQVCGAQSGSCSTGTVVVGHIATTGAVWPTAHCTFTASSLPASAELTI